MTNQASSTKMVSKCKNCGNVIHESPGVKGRYHHPGNWTSCLNYYRIELNQRFPYELPGGQAEPLLEEDIIDRLLDKYK